uniref:Predicted protein n=1 Tax=Hordeum vulgare subsp. vulgare TaxID=112509 RepID=F2DIH6_HORVV|nr:predicted protein [Hordeum vulgare subsp. vulgare]
MFSTFEQILGSWTRFGLTHQGNIDPTLTSQLFPILSKVTCWMWGHEHRFAVYKGNSFGINRSILLGNSAIPVNEHNPYAA